MKRLALLPRIVLPLLTALTFFSLNAQRPEGGGALKSSSSQEKKVYKAGNCWTLSGPLGENIPAEMDTLPYNFQRRAIPAITTDAYATTGNTSSPGMTQIYFDRRKREDFIFRDAVWRWIPSFDSQKFYNVYIPMTLLGYDFAGQSTTKTDNLHAVFAGNVNRRFGAGANVAYIVSRGNYAYQAAKNFNFGFNTYYRGDRYEMQAFMNRYNLVFKENGGITDDLYITDPAQLQGGVSSIEATSIPTRLTTAHSRLSGTEIFVNNAYNVGFWREVEVNDTLTRQVYVPVTKFICTLDYKADSHVFTNRDTSQADEFWDGVHYLNTSGTYDRTHRDSFEATVGVQMIEGFRRWAKFGLSAFATYGYDRLRLPIAYAKGHGTVTNPGEADTEEDGLTELPAGFALKPKYVRNNLWVGGELSKRQGSILTYDAKVRFGLAGEVIGDIEASGGIRTRIPLFGDTAQIEASGLFENREAPLLLKHYVSNHLAWDNDFGKTRRVRAAGNIHLPWTRTRLEAGFENLQNYIYFKYGGLPSQYSGNIQLFYARLDQRIKAGIWNWDNRVTYQTCSDREVIPMPALAVYSNMYLHFRAFKVLDLQIGVDCDWYTKYKSVGYQPATMMFTLGDGTKVGNYPMCNVYVTAKLYKVRFYLMCSHVNQGLGDKNYFSMAHYPINPRRFQFGLSIDFAN